MTLKLRHLSVSSSISSKQPGRLAFEPGLNIVYGDSNTGKSFIVDLINHVLGSRDHLREIEERVGYDKAWLGLSTSSGDFTLARALQGGAVELYQGLVNETTGRNPAVLGERGKDTVDSLAGFMLDKIGLLGRSVLKRVESGEKDILSFRHLIRYVLIREKPMWDDISPFESGDTNTRLLERSVAKLLLTGVDDSAVATVVDRKSHRVSKTARVEVLNGIIEELQGEVASIAPDKSRDELVDQLQQLETSFRQLKDEIDQLELSGRDVLIERAQIVRQLSDHQQRRRDIEIMEQQFERLNSAYQSDIERLDAIEQAGFAFGLLPTLPCPLCGATVEHHNPESDCEGNIPAIQAAAIAERRKIVTLKNDLVATVQHIVGERIGLDQAILPGLRDRLDEIEKKRASLTPELGAKRGRFSEISSARNSVMRAVDIYDRLAEMTRRKDLANNEKYVKANVHQATDMVGLMGDKYARSVESVLKEWRFPGEQRVSFDPGTFDIRVDGKLRSANGKGVRALLHAAMKVGFMLYCRDARLPHPGFLVLDTPLRAYRDASESEDPLADDEAELAASPLKEYFYRHLDSLKEMQFIIMENDTPPPEYRGRAGTTRFFGRHADGRRGFFPS